MPTVKPTLYVTAITLFSLGSALADPAPLRVTVSGIKDGAMMPDRYAYCIADDSGKSKNGPNINPAIEWSGAPAGTKSYALLVVDSDVPEDLSTAYSDTPIMADAKRRDFYHWVLFDIPASLTQIKEGQNSNSFSEQGKSVSKTPYGMNARNDYSAFKEKVVGGYDGPCPPWNDKKMHHYHFHVYALDVATISLPETTDGTTVLQAINSHILAEGKVTGQYTLNKDLR